MEIINKINMKNIHGIFAVLLVTALFMVSCQEDAPEIGTPLSADQINLEVSQPLSIDEGGNTVVLRNLTEGVIPMWDYGIGKSINQIDTVEYAFAGTYVIKRSAWSNGRLVPLPDATVEVTKVKPELVSDPMWTFLSGGADQEKTWVLDFDADGVSRKFDGPIFFIGADKLLVPNCVDGVGSCWQWFPGWQNWMPGPADYGTMTFNLKGGPFVTVDQKVITNSGVFNGTYMIDTKERSISFTGVTPLNMGWDQVWAKAYVYSITEDGMQLAFQKPNAQEYEIYNYIPKP
jgi:hypothetical protein